MTDQFLLANYLLILKSTVEVYVHGTLESSNAKIRKLLKQGLDETMIEQAETYDEMVKCGWYQVANVKNTQINQIIKKIEG